MAAPRRARSATVPSRGEIETVSGNQVPRFSPEGVPGRVQQVEHPLRSPCRLWRGVEAVKARSVWIPTGTLRRPGCDSTVSGPPSPRLLSRPRCGVKEKIPSLPCSRVPMPAPCEPQALTEPARWRQGMIPLSARRCLQHLRDRLAASGSVEQAARPHPRGSPPGSASGPPDAAVQMPGSTKYIGENPDLEHGS